MFQFFELQRDCFRNHPAIHLRLLSWNPCYINLVSVRTNLGIDNKQNQFSHLLNT